MKPYYGYLFDLDGTLVDTAPDLNAALNHTLHQHGFVTVDEAHTRHWVGHGARALISQALLSQNRNPATDERLDELFSTFLDYYSAHIADLSQPYPGVVAALSQLSERGAGLAVVTNKLAGLAEPLLTALEMDGFFRAVVGGDTAPAPKPAADPALHACTALGLEPAESLFVGDSDTDVRCARAAGCPVVVVVDGYSHGTPAHQLGADAVIDSFSDLL